MSTTRKLSEDTTIINLSSASEICDTLRAAELERQVRLTPLFLGAPGQGKSAIVEQVVDRWNRERDLKFERAIKDGKTPDQAKSIAGPRWRLQSYRLAQCDPTDLKGVPIYQNVDGQEMCSFAPPFVFPMIGIADSAGGDNVLIFLDELPQANPTIQNLAANIIDGVVGDHKIDMNRSFIVCAGNRKEDHAATYEVPRNVGNRLIKFSVRTSFEEWQDWAIENDLDPLVIGYLKDKSSLFNEKPPENGYTYGTPRSWHKLACQISSMGEEFFQDKSRISMPMAQGTVGPSNATSFMQFAKAKRANYSVDDIMRGKKVPVPTKEQKDIIFSLAFEFTYRINTWIDQVVLEADYKAIPVGDNKGKAEKLVSLLGKERLEGIKNLYKWMDQEGIDPAFQVLINKYQNSNCREHFRYAMMTRAELKETREIYEKLHKVMIK